MPLTALIKSNLLNQKRSGDGCRKDATFSLLIHVPQMPSLAILIVYLAPTLTICAGVSWRGLLIDQATVYACLGNSLTLPWEFALDPDESLWTVKWYFGTKGSPLSLQAIRLDGNFTFLGSIVKNVTFLPNGGIRIEHLSSEDLGTYKVTISIKEKGQMVTRSQSVRVDVPANSNSADRHVLTRALFQTATNQWYVQQPCDNLADFVRPTEVAVWNAPLSKQQEGTHNGKSTFMLILENDVKLEEYTCRLQIPTQTLLCANNSVPLSETVIEFKSVHKGLRALETEVQKLKAENEELKSILQHYEVRIETLNMEQRAEVAVLKGRQRRDVSSCSTDVTKPASCKDIRQRNSSSGIFTLYLPESEFKALDVYCDQTTDGGNWIVIQRRVDGTRSFVRNAEVYERGFGDLRNNFWIGLKNIHLLTNRAMSTLRVDLKDFMGATAFAEYSSFRLSGPEDNYRISLGWYRGTAGDGLRDSNKAVFSVPVKGVAFSDCALLAGSGWWFNNCTLATLNGPYKTNVVQSVSSDCIGWPTWKNGQPLSRVEMKIRV